MSREKNPFYKYFVENKLTIEQANNLAGHCERFNKDRLEILKSYAKVSTLLSTSETFYMATILFSDLISIVVDWEIKNGIHNEDAKETAEAVYQMVSDMRKNIWDYWKDTNPVIPEEEMWKIRVNVEQFLNSVVPSGEWIFKDLHASLSLYSNPNNPESPLYNPEKTDPAA